jgi:hypothetical protein
MLIKLLSLPNANSTLSAIAVTELTFIAEDNTNNSCLYIRERSFDNTENIFLFLNFAHD